MSGANTNGKNDGKNVQTRSCEIMKPSQKPQPKDIETDKKIQKGKKNIQTGKKNIQTGKKTSKQAKKTSKQAKKCRKIFAERKGIRQIL